MELQQLKENLATPSAQSRKLYHQHPTLYRDVVIVEDYFRQVATNQAARIPAPMTRARLEILSAYGIGQHTFYEILGLVRSLCTSSV